jgi:hypothetical protein
VIENMFFRYESSKKMSLSGSRGGNKLEAIMQVTHMLLNW